MIEEIEEKFKQKYGIYYKYYYCTKIKEYEKLYSFFYVFETQLKNKIEKELTLIFGKNWKMNEIFTRIQKKDDKGEYKKLTLGFWVMLFSSYYHDLIWSKKCSVKNIFPFLKNKNLKVISHNLLTIKKFRNDVFHFEYDVENINFIEEGKKLINEYIRAMTGEENSVQQPALLMKNVASDYVESISRQYGYGFIRAKRNKKEKINTFNNLFDNIGDISKHIDYKISNKKYSFYLKISFLENSGGAQDNQYKDIQDFLNHCRDCNEKNTIFLAICDGDYYLQKDSKTVDETRIKRLQRLTDNKTSFVLSIDELEGFLNEF